MPAGEPVLGSGSSNGQLVGDDLENSNAGSGHPRQGGPAPDAARRSPLRPALRARASTATAGKDLNPSLADVTHVPRHERPITWDICPEPRHRRSRLLACLLQQGGKRSGYVANLGGMDRSEAEAVYDSGRERCVGVIVELAAGVEQLGARCERLEERIRRLEERARRDSRTSSKPAVK